MADEYVLEHGLPCELSYGLRHVASLVERDAEATKCVEALQITARMLRVCQDGEELEYIPVKNTIIVVQKRMKEILVMRVQSTLPFGDAKKFEEAVKYAFGGVITQNLYSTVMQAYTKVIWKNFAFAFPSKCEVEKIARGETRKRKEKKK